MKIYISSTIEDLKDFRLKVSAQLHKINQHVIFMEDYTASDQRPLAKCLADVAAADVYVGIFAWRYGYIPKKNNPQKKSITELEYQQALKLHKECLIFLLNKGVPWPPDFMDSHWGGKEAGKNINRLRNELLERHSISWFSNTDQLAGDVQAAVYQVQTKLLMTPSPELNTEQVNKISPALVVTSKGRKRATPRDGYPRLWKPGTTLGVRFLDGSPTQRSFVKRFANIWSAYANLLFDFNDDVTAELRVSFEQDGSWSYVGADALKIDPTEPTINFGWLTDSTSIYEADYLVLHEFGRVLGLQNEHQNPLEKIPWNKKAVYTTLQNAPNYWTKEQVDFNYFTHWDKSFFPIEKSFDPQSIMAFPLLSEFTTGNFKMEPNRSLSSGDKEFVSQLYPFAIKK